MWDIITRIAAGVSGGVVLGVADFVQNRWTDKEAFDWQKFAKSMTLPLAAGLIAGATSSTAEMAFAMGVFGKKIQELAAAYPK